MGYPRKLELTLVGLLIEFFFRFCIGLYRGHCFVLDFSSSSSLPHSQCVSPGLPCGFIFLLRSITPNIQHKIYHR